MLHRTTSQNFTPPKRLWEAFKPTLDEETSARDGVTVAIAERVHRERDLEELDPDVIRFIDEVVDEDLTAEMHRTETTSADATPTHEPE